MFTIKLIHRPKDGLSLDRVRAVSALSYSTKVILTEAGSFSHHVFECEDYKENQYSWDIVEDVIIYVENLAGKTIGRYHYSAPVG